MAADMTPLNLPFDTFDWICGLVINGFLAFFVLAAITAAGRPLWGIRLRVILARRPPPHPAPTARKRRRIFCNAGRYEGQPS